MAGERDYQYIGYDTDTTDDDQNTDSQISGYIWDFTTTNEITFSFIDSASDIGYTLNPGVAFDSQFSATWQVAQKLAMEEFVKVIDVVFTEYTGANDVNATMRFMNVTGISTAYGYYPFSNESAGDQAYNESNYDNDANLGTYTFATMMHEMGHAMGLKHGHETWGPGALQGQYNSHEYSIMTYNSHAYNAAPFYTIKDGNYAQSLMMFDISALQRMYGADFTTEATNTVYTFDSTTGEMFINGVGQGAAMTNNNVNSNIIFRTIWDGDGKDTYDFSNFSTDLAISLIPGEYSDLDTNGNTYRSMLNQGWDSSGTFVGASAEVWAVGHLFNALQYNGDDRSLIEHATGGIGDDLIVGNQAANRLIGLDGADTIFGGAGKDGIKGGRGRDILEGEDGKDNIRGGKGKDRLEGGDGNDTLKGEKGQDKLYGQKGDDTLFGGSGEADIFMFARGHGNDVIKDWDFGLDKIQIFTNIHYSGYSASDVGGDKVIDYGYGNTVTLEGMAGITLTSSDFILV